MPGREVWEILEFPAVLMQMRDSLTWQKHLSIKAKLALDLTYTPWLKDLGLNDVYLLALGGYHKLDDNQAISGWYTLFQPWKHTIY